jgi:hypothetical protein
MQIGLRATCTLIPTQPAETPDSAGLSMKEVAAMVDSSSPALALHRFKVSKIALTQPIERVYILNS